MRPRVEHPGYELVGRAALPVPRPEAICGERGRLRVPTRRPSVPMQTLLSDDEIASLNVDLETWQPSDILAWALEKSEIGRAHV